MARNQRLEALAAPAMDKVRTYYGLMAISSPAPSASATKPEAGISHAGWLRAWNMALKARTPVRYQLPLR
ncbi:hypothetical protein HMEPL2_00490 [Vreelandella aquamarina]|uniref:Uncharacterized protein n=1 Tax=Vreelandella aquamarina TaxID=77097 RepID=A0A6F8X6I6_9GAMM|nr:hypothetical protein HMEPL2_00490 [Halomonas meridiana]